MLNNNAFSVIGCNHGLHPLGCMARLPEAIPCLLIACEWRWQ